MELLEYQAKELFKEVGIPVLPSQTIEDPRKLKRLEIPYPVVLKSQVRVGGRGRAGGIRFVENTIDAIAAARTIFNLPIMGEYPQVLLAEAHYDAQQEFFLAVVLDYHLQRPVLLGSARGGMDVEALLENIQKVVIEDEFSPFYARRLSIKMGLQGVSIGSVSAVIEKMYHLFIDKDLDLVEINPLGISANHDLMALDGKITVNKNALSRHPDILLLPTPEKMERWENSYLEEEETNSIPAPTAPEPQWLNGIDEKAPVGIICNSLGLGLMSWDLISMKKEKVACCSIVGEETNGKLLPSSTLSAQLEMALENLSELKKLKVILVNIIGSPETIETVTVAIADYLQAKIEQQSDRPEIREKATSSVSSSRRTSNSRYRSRKQQSVKQLQFVLRLVGGQIDPITESFATMPVYCTDNLEQAVARTISLAKSR